QVGHRALLRHPGLHEVEQEEAGAAAELEGALVGQVGVGGGGVEAAARVVDAALVVGDRPLVVVALGLPVVVQHLGELGVGVGGLDLFGGGVRVRGRIDGLGVGSAHGVLTSRAG